ncbi:patatin-like phospholipase family protein [Sandarakinorhabdus oryzae]|uniref:patatin-like phospholipase family protein n=1 Tax=Sandarakinorhabdus oryzae TaxID=2675220 RepID=UPI0012E20D95|nr:patatin-like phospholipase family protein [Sandarakinorhabdus oryzae]
MTDPQAIPAITLDGDAQGRALDCDLIMKGGVTSGLVYPGAIATLSETYRLRNIGGTSAGAIGAVAAAAMEYGLRTGRNTNARETMAWLHRELAATTDQGASRLDAMFCGDPGTAPLLDALKGLLNSRPAALFTLIGAARPTLPDSARRALRLTAAATILETLAAAGLAWLLTSGCSAGWQGLATGLATVASFAATGWWNLRGSLAQAVSPSLDEVNRLLQPVVANGLGLATGLALPAHTINQRQVPSLTHWLHQTIQSLAGHDADRPEAVLTFGKLWSLGLDAEPSAYGPRAIDLVLVCSDLNRVQSASFPFLPDNQRLFYDPDEWVRLFPEPVLQALAARAWQIRSNPMPDDLGYRTQDVIEAAAAHGDLGDRLRLLPKGRHIPILVGTRASMAFPGLFTPLPLWVLRWVGRPEVQDERRPVLSRVYLSDGGITSNFPIHLFDSVVPSRPTFAINLLYPDDDLSIEEYRELDGAAIRGKAVPGNVRTLGGTRERSEGQVLADLIMPFADGDRVTFYKEPATGTALARLAGLGLRVVETARTWGDVSLYNQVGMRDRIIHVRLAGSEGGFNLSMPSQTITTLNEKGVYAGTVLACRFRREDPVDPLDDPDRPRFTLTWANHRRIRTDGFLAAQDLLSGRFAERWPSVSAVVTDPHFRQVATMLASIGALVVPAPDPVAAALRPLNLLRMRPAESDPRASRRAEPPPPSAPATD